MTVDYTVITLHGLTVDPTRQRVEFRHHARIAKALNKAVYFADSFASWQKGAIENTNKLIRQYIPKGSDFNYITNGYIYMMYSSS